MLKDQAEELRIENYGKSVYECFLDRVAKNLKVVISLEAGNSNLSAYLTNNPAILKKCDIFWMKKMNSESLRTFAENTLTEKFSSTYGQNAP